MNRKSKRYEWAELKSCCGKQLSHEDIQKRLLEMLAEFDCFCREKGLIYFLAGGSLLGAVRHQGFIPWDDDVDIIMPRPEYERLLGFSKIGEELEIVSFLDDRGYYHPYPYCNIADRKTVMFEHHARRLTGKGLFLDVFPLDGVPSDLKERKKFYRRLMIVRYIKGLQSNPYRRISAPKDLVMNLLAALLTPLDEMKLTADIDALAKSHILERSKDCAMLLVLEPDLLTWPRADWEERVETEFEGHRFFIPKAYDAVLTKQFGDYMVPPPKEERAGHHGLEVFWRKERG